MTNYVYKVIETDVDGCGGMSFEYVSSFKKLTQNELKVFHEMLRDVKGTHQKDGYDTFETIKEACKMFEELYGTELRLAFPPYEGVIEF